MILASVSTSEAFLVRRRLVAYNEDSYYALALLDGLFLKLVPSILFVDNISLPVFSVDPYNGLQSHHSSNLLQPDTALSDAIMGADASF